MLLFYLRDLNSSLRFYLSHSWGSNLGYHIHVDLNWQSLLCCPSNFFLLHRQICKRLKEAPIKIAFDAPADGSTHQSSTSFKRASREYIHISKFVADLCIRYGCMLSSARISSNRATRGWADCIAVKMLNLLFVKIKTILHVLYITRTMCAAFSHSLTWRYCSNLQWICGIPHGASGGEIQ